MASAHRSYKEECSFIERLDESSFLIKKGFVPNMKVFKTAVVSFHGHFVPSIRRYFAPTRNLFNRLVLLTNYGAK